MHLVAELRFICICFRFLIFDELVSFFFVYFFLFLLL